MLILIAALALSLGGVSLVFLQRAHDQGGGQQARGPRPGKTSTVALAVSAKAPLIRTRPRGSGERELREVERLIAKFGVAGAHAGNVLVGVRLVAVAVLALGAFLLASRSSMLGGSRTMPALVATACGIAGWFLPAMFIGRLIKKRTKAVVAGLPDALELLVICVEAGLAFEDGLGRIVGELEKSQPALAEELAFTAADLKILPSREQALANFAERMTRRAFVRW
jgi:tight adherence protein C